MTEQGEMLQALFGFPEIAVRTMEVYTTGTLEAWLTPVRGPSDEWRACMDRLAADAREGYRCTVYDDPRFIDYFHASTPEAEIGDLNIGSRPARRGGGSSVAGLRAIPWQFAWTQTRLMLGAWLGVEEALDRAFERGEGERLKAMYRDWPQFQSAIDLIEMVLAKADGRIAAEYDRRLVPPSLQPLGDDLRARLARAIQGVRAVSGHGELLESSARDPPVDRCAKSLCRSVEPGAGGAVAADARPPGPEGPYGAHGYRQRHCRRHAKHGLGPVRRPAGARFSALNFARRAP